MFIAFSRFVNEIGYHQLDTAYKKLPAHYPIVPSPTPYDLPFSQYICDRQTTDGRTTDVNRPIDALYSIAVARQKPTVGKYN